MKKIEINNKKLKEMEGKSKGLINEFKEFIKRGSVNYNVQVVVYDGIVWTDDLHFRNYMRLHPAIVR